MKNKMPRDNIQIKRKPTKEYFILTNLILVMSATYVGALWSVSLDSSTPFRDLVMFLLLVSMNYVIITKYWVKVK